MSSHDTSASTTDVTTHAGIDLWRVQLATGEVRVMSLDALDDAFQAGIITESSPVLPPGATAWTRLADAAGLDAPSHESNVPSVAPMAVSIVGVDGRRDALRRTRRLLAARPRPRCARGRGVQAEARARVRRDRPRGALRRRSRLRRDAHGQHRRAREELAERAGAKAAAAAPPPAAVDLNEAAPAKTLTEEQKAKLAEADKAREAAAAAREAQRQKDRPSAPAKRGPREKTTTPFVNGGNKYDPLNGAL